MFFTHNKIFANNENVGQQLMKARLAKNSSLLDVAGAIRINIKYLQALENGNLENIPAGIYAQNYLHSYAEYLGLNAKILIAQHQEENKEWAKGTARKLFVEKTTKARYFLSLPKLFKTVAIITVICTCVIYIGLYINDIIAPPELQIYFPLSDVTIHENKLNIRGKAETNSDIIINGNEILIGPKGEISYDLTLKEGINTIVIQAQKKYSKKNIIIRNVLVE